MAKHVNSAAEFDSQLSAAGAKLVVVDFHATCKCYSSSPNHASALELTRLFNPHTCSLVQGADHASSSRPSTSRSPNRYVPFSLESLAPDQLILAVSHSRTDPLSSLPQGRC